jgi:hypothetical protein
LAALERAQAPAQALAQALAQATVTATATATVMVMVMVMVMVVAPAVMVSECWAVAAATAGQNGARYSPARRSRSFRSVAPTLFNLYLRT